ncbi:MAG: polyphosphate kinase 2 [Gammaproteobacteria bacterium]|nr:polyphosphate kinase 2 [Gammaproteobacteria bacterium]
MTKKKTGKTKKSSERKVDIVDAYHEDDPRLRGEKEKALPKKYYEEELFRLQIELVKLQEWVKKKGLKVVVIFEGRDAAGKGGVIKRIVQHLNPRVCRIVALAAPTEREKTQWYFQRYVEHLPAAGEIVLLDRSWYNRAGVEKVMGFCSYEEHQEFLRFCPEFESALVRSGTILIKYWFSVSNLEQDKRFRARALELHKRWKLSPMDLESRTKWVEYSKAKDEMFLHTDTAQVPWFVVPSDDKKRARLNCMAHFLSMIPYKDILPEVPKIPPLNNARGYKRSPMHRQTFIPKKY